MTVGTRDGSVKSRRTAAAAPRPGGKRQELRGRGRRCGERTDPWEGQGQERLRETTGSSRSAADGSGSCLPAHSVQQDADTVLFRTVFVKCVVDGARSDKAARKRGRSEELESPSVIYSGPRSCRAADAWTLSQRSPPTVWKSEG